MFTTSKVITLDLSSFDTSKVTNSMGMFSSNENLKTIYASNKFTNNISNSNGMFTDCTSLVGGNGTTYDSTKVNAEYARIDTESTPGYFTLKTN